MKIPNWAVAMLATVAAVGIAVAMLPALAQQPSEAPDQATVDKGKITYAQNCSHCHGPNMINSGTVTPDLRAFPDDKTRFVTTVKQGKNGRMPPWGDILNDEQIADVWAFLSSRRKP